MCAGFEEDECETFRRLIEDIYPSGIISIVSDTWDLWRVLTEYIPRLKDKILARDGKLVIRPDSGDPVNILCGEPMPKDGNYTVHIEPKHKGTLRLLAETLKTDSNRAGLPLINKAAAIYGDSITVERAEQIMYRVVNELKLSPYNVVLGIGSYTYEYVTRDTYGFAMKATAVTRGGKLYNIFKKPVTDSGTKNSHKGIPCVYRTEWSTEEKPEYFCVQESKPEALDKCAFQKVYSGGWHLIEEKFDTIRKRVRE
jgi:nicotinamide phosphoribosyltransferase